MRHVPFFLIASLFANTSIRAQDLFVEAHSTFQFPIGGITASEAKWEVSPNNGQRFAHIKKVNLNWGRGPGVGLLIGYRLNDHMEAVLRSTFFAFQHTRWTSYHVTDADGIVRENDRATLSMRYLRIEPAVRIRTGMGRTSWYLMVGPSFAMLPKSTWSENNEQDVPTPWIGHVESTTESSGRVGLGGSGAVGFMYQPGRIGFFGEINATAMSWVPKRSKLTRFDQNGTDVLHTVSVYDAETEFVNEYDYGVYPVDPDKPRKSLHIQYPMSTWGILVGVRLNLAKNKA
ncbi:MAG: hypothetical protein IPP83_15775 [Flavobacteriales bacterium]|nr:hypothetical protein [Flavobacteriales bacterium]